jgi:hypothetical protein
VAPFAVKRKLVALVARKAEQLGMLFENLHHLLEAKTPADGIVLALQGMEVERSVQHLALMAVEEGCESDAADLKRQHAAYCALQKYAMENRPQEVAALRFEAQRARAPIAAGGARAQSHPGREGPRELSGVLHQGGGRARSEDCTAAVSGCSGGGGSRDVLGRAVHLALNFSLFRICWNLDPLRLC